MICILTLSHVRSGRDLKIMAIHTARVLLWIIFAFFFVVNASAQSRDEWCPKVAKELAKAKGEASTEKRTAALGNVLSFINRNQWSNVLCSNGAKSYILSELGRYDEAFAIAEEASETNYPRGDREVIDAFRLMYPVALKYMRVQIGNKEWINAGKASLAATALTTAGSAERREVDEARGDMFVATDFPEKAIKAYELAGATGKLQELKNKRSQKESGEENATLPDGSPNYNRRFMFYSRKIEELRKDKKFEDAIVYQEKRLQLHGNEKYADAYYISRAQDYRSIAQRDNSASAANSCLSDIKKARSLPEFNRAETDSGEIAADCYAVAGQFQTAYDEMVTVAFKLSDTWWETDAKGDIVARYANIIQRAKAAGRNITRNAAFETGVKTGVLAEWEQRLAKLAADPKATSGDIYIHDPYISYFDTAVYILQIDPDNAAANRALREIYGFFETKPSFAPPEKFRQFLIQWKNDGYLLTSYYRDIGHYFGMADATISNATQAAQMWENETAKRQLTGTVAYCGKALENATFFENIAKGFSDPTVVPPSVYDMISGLRKNLPAIKKNASSCIDNALKTRTKAP